MVGLTVKIVLSILMGVQLQLVHSKSQFEILDKAVKTSGEILDQEAPITINKIKDKLNDTGVFNWKDPSLTDRQKKEMTKLFDAVEIMMTSRSRQPSNVQNMFSTLRLVERVVKKQLKERHISKGLATKFQWKNLKRTDNDEADVKPEGIRKHNLKKHKYSNNKHTAWISILK